MNTFRLSPLAQRDLDEAWLYVALDGGVSRADRLIDQITRRFALLAQYPDAGRLRDDIAAGTRSFAVKNYLIYYRPFETGVLIARVLHGKRDQSVAFTAEPTDR